MPWEDIIYSDIQGASLQITPTLITWNQPVIMRGYVNDFTFSVETGSRFPLLEAYRTGFLIQIGAPHSGYNGAYAIRCTIEPQTQDSSMEFRQMVTWAMAGNFSELTIDSYQSVEVRNYDYEHVLAVVPFKSAIPGTTNERVPFVASLRTIKIVRSMRISQWEVYTNSEANIRDILVGPDEAVWNLDAIWGFLPGELLYVGVKSATDGTPLYKRDYQLLITPSSRGGWSHVYSIYQDSRGLVPSTDVTPIDPSTVQVTDGTITNNGAAAFKVLRGVKFADVFSNIKPPINVGN